MNRQHRRNPDNPDFCEAVMVSEAEVERYRRESLGKPGRRAKA